LFWITFFRLITSLMSVADDFFYLCELLFVELLDMVAILQIIFYSVWQLRTGPSYLFILSILLFQREYFNTVNQLFNQWKPHNSTVATRYKKIPSLVRGTTQILPSPYIFIFFCNIISIGISCPTFGFVYCSFHGLSEKQKKYKKKIKNQAREKKITSNMFPLKDKNIPFRSYNLPSADDSATLFFSQSLWSRSLFDIFYLLCSKSYLCIIIIRSRSRVFV